MADKQITPFQLTDQFTMDNFNQRINETNIALQKMVNPNLLDNWYFVNPVDQRQGYVVPPGVAYTNVITSETGTTETYSAVDRFDGAGKAVFVYNGAVCTCDRTAVVRGYTGVGYGIDRWKIAYNPDSLSLLVTDSGLKVGGSITTGLFLGQWFEDGFAKGLINRICTVSLLFSDGTFVTGSGVFPEKDGVDATLINTNDVIVYLQYNASSQNKPCVVMVLKNASKAVFAAKLELGSQQTLAHQENGVWVLNEIPDYGEQLRRCHGYLLDSRESGSENSYSGIANETWLLVTNVVFPEVMREIPGVKLYNHSAVDHVRRIADNADLSLPASMVVSRTKNDVTFIYEPSHADTFIKGAAYDFNVVANAEL